MGKKKGTAHNGPIGLRHGFDQGEWNTTQKKKVGAIGPSPQPMRVGGQPTNPGSSFASRYSNTGASQGTNPVAGGQQQARGSAISAADPRDMRPKTAGPDGRVTNRPAVGSTPRTTGSRATRSTGGGPRAITIPAGPVGRAPTGGVYDEATQTSRVAPASSGSSRGSVMTAANGPAESAQSRTSQMRSPPNMAAAMSQPREYSTADDSGLVQTQRERDGRGSPAQGSSQAIGRTSFSSPGSTRRSGPSNSPTPGPTGNEDHTVRNLGIGAAVAGGAALALTRSPRVAAAVVRAAPRVGPALVRGAGAVTGMVGRGARAAVEGARGLANSTTGRWVRGTAAGGAGLIGANSAMNAGDNSSSGGTDGSFRQRHPVAADVATVATGAIAAGLGSRNIPGMGASRSVRPGFTPGVRPQVTASTSAAATTPVPGGRSMRGVSSSWGRAPAPEPTIQSNVTGAVPGPTAPVSPNAPRNVPGSGGRAPRPQVQAASAPTRVPPQHTPSQGEQDAMASLSRPPPRAPRASGAAASSVSTPESAPVAPVGATRAAPAGRGGRPPTSTRNAAPVAAPPPAPAPVAAPAAATRAPAAGRGGRAPTATTRTPVESPGTPAGVGGTAAAPAPSRARSGGPTPEALAAIESEGARRQPPGRIITPTPGAPLPTKRTGNPFNRTRDGEHDFVGPSGVNHGMVSRADGGGFVKGEPSKPFTSNHSDGRSNSGS